MPSTSSGSGSPPASASASPLLLVDLALEHVSLTRRSSPTLLCRRMEVFFEPQQEDLAWEDVRDVLLDAEAAEPASERKVLPASTLASRMEDTLAKLEPGKWRFVLMLRSLVHLARLRQLMGDSWRRLEETVAGWVDAERWEGATEGANRFKATDGLRGRRLAETVKRLGRPPKVLVRPLHVVPADVSPVSIHCSTVRAPGKHFDHQMAVSFGLYLPETGKKALLPVKPPSSAPESVLHRLGFERTSESDWACHGAPCLPLSEARRQLISLLQEERECVGRPLVLLAPKPEDAFPTILAEVGADKAMADTLESVVAGLMTSSSESFFNDFEVSMRQTGRPDNVALWCHQHLSAHGLDKVLSQQCHPLQSAEVQVLLLNSRMPEFMEGFHLVQVDSPAAVEGGGSAEVRCRVRHFPSFQEPQSVLLTSLVAYDRPRLQERRASFKGAEGDDALTCVILNEGADKLILEAGATVGVAVRIECAKEEESGEREEEEEGEKAITDSYVDENLSCVFSKHPLIPSLRPLVVALLKRLLKEEKESNDQCYLGTHAVVDTIVFKLVSVGGGFGMARLHEAARRVDDGNGRGDASAWEETLDAMEPMLRVCLGNQWIMRVLAEVLARFHFDGETADSSRDTRAVPGPDPQDSGSKAMESAKESAPGSADASGGKDSRTKTAKIAAGPATTQKPSKSETVQETLQESKMVEASSAEPAQKPGVKLQKAPESNMVKGPMVKSSQSTSQPLKPAAVTAANACSFLVSPGSTSGPPRGDASAAPCRKRKRVLAPDSELTPSSSKGPQFSVADGVAPEDMEEEEDEIGSVGGPPSSPTPDPEPRNPFKRLKSEESRDLSRSLSRSLSRERSHHSSSSPSPPGVSNLCKPHRSSERLCSDNLKCTLGARCPDQHRIPPFIAQKLNCCFVYAFGIASKNIREGNCFKKKKCSFRHLSKGELMSEYERVRQELIEKCPNCHPVGGDLLRRTVHFNAEDESGVVDLRQRLGPRVELEEEEEEEEERPAPARKTRGGKNPADIPCIFFAKMRGCNRKSCHYSHSSFNLTTCHATALTPKATTINCMVDCEWSLEGTPVSVVPVEAIGWQATARARAYVGKGNRITVRICAKGNSGAEIKKGEKVAVGNRL